MSIITREELNIDQLRSTIKEVWLGAETLHYLVYSECGDDMVRWAADQLANRAADLKKLCDEVHPDPDEED